MLRKLLGIDRLEYRIAKQGKQLNRIERMLAEMNHDAASADKRQILKSHFPPIFLKADIDTVENEGPRKPTNKSLTAV